MNSIGKMMIIIGLILIVTGSLWYFLPEIGLGKFPGDILFKKKNISIYIPFTTSLIISAVISAIIWLIKKL